MLISEIKSEFARKKNWKVLRTDREHQLSGNFRHPVRFAGSSTAFPHQGVLRIRRNISERKTSMTTHNSDLLLYRSSR